MADVVLKYLSIITVAGAAVSFVVGLLKYLDQGSREERTKRFELYHGLMRNISAVGDKDAGVLPLTQQVAAIYELQHFSEYSYASIPILKHLKAFYEGKEARQVLLTAIGETLTALGAPDA
ncbi:MAG: hypothetical protein WCD08_13145 [Steroidobacteraceae bacterium]